MAEGLFAPAEFKSSDAEIGEAGRKGEQCHDGVFDERPRFSWSRSEFDLLCYFHIYVLFFFFALSDQAWLAIFWLFICSV